MQLIEKTNYILNSTNQKGEAVYFRATKSEAMKVRLANRYGVLSNKNTTCSVYGEGKYGKAISAEYAAEERLKDLPRVEKILTGPSALEHGTPLLPIGNVMGFEVKGFCAQTPYRMEFEDDDPNVRMLLKDRTYYSIPTYWGINEVINFILTEYSVNMRRWRHYFKIIETEDSFRIEIHRHDVSNYDWVAIWYRKESRLAMLKDMFSDMVSEK